MMNRRTLLLASAAAASSAGLASAKTPLRVLEPKKGMAKLAPDDLPETAIWGYNGTVPGPELRLRQGEEVGITLRNGLSQPTTIHWHGIRIDNAMDGVAALTQEPVAPDSDFDYRFQVPDAGTFWYHPHNRSWEQLARGLYGPLIVEEEEPPAYDRDIVLMLDDWRLNDDAQIDEESFGSLRDWSHAGRLGNWPTVNGAPQPTYPVKRNERLRLRLLNVANASVMVLRLDGMSAHVVAHDGMPVPPEPLDGGLVLAPAQRVDLIADVTGEEAALMLTGRENFRAVSFDVKGKARPAPLRDPMVLPPNPLATDLDLDDPVRATLRIGGGAMGGLTEAYKGGFMAHHRGEEPVTGLLPLRTLAQEHGLVWAFNGIAGMTVDPFLVAERGQTVVVKMVNEGRWPHAMHFHGHHFRETTQGAPWRDTLLVGPLETKEIAFVADNPGRWMLHCHMLEHQAGGMGTWFEVT